MNMERIGWIGLGIMGTPMVRRLLADGRQVTVLDHKIELMTALAREGAKTARTPKELAEQSEIIITMLPDSPDVESVVQGEDGILQAVRPGMLFIDLATIEPAVSKKMYAWFKARSVQALDAPVSGGDVGARDGTLSIMAGGDKPAFERAMPVFKVLGKNIVYIGQSGAGQTTKACNQIVVGITMQGVAEALTFARKAGVDVALVREALLGGFAQSRILDLHGKRVLERNFTPGFKVKLPRKEMNIVLQTGRALEVPLPLSALVANQM